MSLPRSRTPRHNNNNQHYHSPSPSAFRPSPPVSDDLPRPADKRTRLPPPQYHNNPKSHHPKGHTHTSSTILPAHPITTSSPTSKMGQPPQPTSVGSEQPYYFIPNMQSFDPSREAEWQSQPWMMATIIEDDDLTFGGKSLSTWYEEDRRRCSLGDDDGENGRPAEFVEEEERRGRQRDRPRYEKASHSHHKHHHHHHHKTSSKANTGEQKH